MLKSFFNVVMEVWQQGFLGIDIGRIVVSIIIFSLFFALRNKITNTILFHSERVVRKIGSETAAKILETLRAPLRMIPVILGTFFAIDYLNLDDNGLKIIADRTVRTLISCNIFWAFYVSIAPITKIFDPLKKIVTAEAVEWLIKTIKFLVIFFNVATVLEIWGINVGALIAGIGLFGIAGALGAQDLVKNLISGILIIAEKRFRIGDWILVDGVVEGTVEQIGFRSTLVRRFDKAPVFVPNASLADTAVTNFSEMTYRRIFFHIGLVYSTKIEQLQNVRDRIEDYITKNSDFVPSKDAPLFVRIDRFNDSSIDIMLYCFTKTKIWGDWLKIKEDLALEIKKIVEEEKTSFAFPSQSVYLENLPILGERPEIFVPPAKKNK
ncbi:MAG: mechanosensitive ion channel family protein [Alphaproteobacteria bacterium]